MSWRRLAIDVGVPLWLLLAVVFQTQPLTAAEAGNAPTQTASGANKVEKASKGKDKTQDVKTREIKSPRDPATGQATGKRTHKP